MASGVGWLVAVVGVGALGAVVLSTRSPGCPAGQLAIQLQVQGPGTISAGGGAVTRSQLTICPRSGDLVQYQAIPDAGHAFLRFEGPGGVTTSQNPFSAPSGVAGFVRAVFQ
jgi:hypothetical protein